MPTYTVRSRYAFALAAPTLISKVTATFGSIIILQIVKTA